jgi:hypothetical protein
LVTNFFRKARPKLDERLKEGETYSNWEKHVESKRGISF